MEKLYLPELISCCFFVFSLLASLMLLILYYRRNPQLCYRFPREKLYVLLMACILSMSFVFLGANRVEHLSLLLATGNVFLWVRVDELRNESLFIWLLLPIFVLWAFLSLYLSSNLYKIGVDFLFLLIFSFVELFWVLYFVSHRVHSLSVSLVTMAFELQLLKFFSLLLFCFSCLFYSFHYASLSILALALFTFYVSFLSVLSVSGSPILFHSKISKTLKDNILRNFGAGILSGMESDKGSRKIYERLCQYFENEKPYLNPELSEKEVAHALYTNKVYLGRAIKHYSNLNFKKFVNHYRVLHAQELFTSNRSLKVTQLYMMSGFKNKATFATAFHLEVGENPKEWCDYIRSKNK